MAVCGATACAPAARAPPRRRCCETAAISTSGGLRPHQLHRLVHVGHHLHLRPALEELPQGVGDGQRGLGDEDAGKGHGVLGCGNRLTPRALPSPSSPPRRRPGRCPRRSPSAPSRVARLLSSSVITLSLSSDLELLVGVAAIVANGDLVLFARRLHRLGDLLAALLGQRGNRQADDLAVVLRGEAQVGLEQRLLDVLEDALVPRLDGDQPGLGHGHRGALGQRRRACRSS